MSQKIQGSYIIGEFRGYTEDERFPQLIVRVGDPTDKSPVGYVERIDFAPFDSRTGARVTPDWLKAGSRIGVLVRVVAKTFVRDGETKAFGTYKALQIVDASGWS